MSGVNWSYFNKFDRATDMYLPDTGEGDTMATQVVTSVSKLVYKWYNDGDVFDNRYRLTGWVNDLSDFANWLYSNIQCAQEILMKITDLTQEGDYEILLQELADCLLDMEFLEELNKQPKQGTIYDCDGPFAFEDWDEEDCDEVDEEDCDEEEDY